MIHDIDYVLGFKVAQRDALNELVTLQQLGTGLASLAQTVAQLEAPLQTKGNIVCMFDLSPIGVDRATADLLPCLFHWYGTSIYNYARLVGFLSGIDSGIYPRAVSENVDNYKTIDDHCAAYVKGLPELENIVVWRHKVFAHFALTAPRNNKKDTDNAALLDVSTMSPVYFSHGRFRVGGIVVSARGGGM